MVILHTVMSNRVKRSLVMFCYGYLFGFIKLIKDSHHDEVFIEETQQVVMENNRWLLSFDELLAIARELGYGKVTVIDYYGDYNGREL